MVDIYPPDLSVSQLPSALADLADPLRHHDIAITFMVDPLPEMDIDVVTTIYRVAHEALANVTEHAEASNVSIQLETDSIGRNGELRRTPEAVILSIIDDGIGIDPDKLDRRSDGHLGLRLLTTRVEDLGGTLTVTVAPNGGTEVRARLPLDPDLVSA
jgi:signal transduction histidine kinase